MISHRYIVEQPSPPSRLKNRFDQQIMPIAIDAAASVEAALTMLGERTRRQPSTTLACMFAAGFFLGRLLGKAGRSARSTP